MNEILFTKPGCQKCIDLKVRMERSSIISPEFVDATSVDGMALGAFHEILKETFPVLVAGDGRIVTGVVNILRELKEASQPKEAQE